MIAFPFFFFASCSFPLADNWAKLERYKAGCLAGCNFAAHAESKVSATEQESVYQGVWTEEKLAPQICDSDLVEKQRWARESWSLSMRQKCFESCLTSFKSDQKLQHSCSDGCDVYFDIIQN